MSFRQKIYIIYGPINVDKNTFNSGEKSYFVFMINTHHLLIAVNQVAYHAIRSIVWMTKFCVRERELWAVLALKDYRDLMLEKLLRIITELQKMHHAIYSKMVKKWYRFIIFLSRKERIKLFLAAILCHTSLLINVCLQRMQRTHS